jgi:hypothetical protein
MLLAYSASSAAAILVGNIDNLQRLVPLQLKGKDGESLSLGFRTTRIVIGLGIYIKNQGYVLLPEEGSTLYYPLDDKQIDDMQADGSLPSTLPEHSLPLIEYIYGYSLWIAIAVISIYIRWDEVRREKIEASQRSQHLPPA